jgi:hypothetical protein
LPTARGVASGQKLVAKKSLSQIVYENVNRTRRQIGAPISKFNVEVATDSCCHHPNFINLIVEQTQSAAQMAKGRN